MEDEQHCHFVACGECCDRPDVIRAESPNDLEIGDHVAWWTCWGGYAHHAVYIGKYIISFTRA